MADTANLVATKSVMRLKRVAAEAAAKDHRQARKAYLAEVAKVGRELRPKPGEPKFVNVTLDDTPMIVRFTRTSGGEITATWHPAG